MREPEERDDVIERIAQELQKLPPVPSDAAARVLARVDAARKSGQSIDADDEEVIFFPSSTEELRASPSAGVETVRVAPAGTRGGSRLGRKFMVSLPAALGYALAATVAGFLIRGAIPRAPGNVEATRAPSGAPVNTSGRDVMVVPAAASTRALQEAPLTVQFVLDAKRAKSVAVVGDFNGWDGSLNPLQRDSSSGVWSALVNIRPGRHVYAFLVDGTTWTLDPNAPRTKDPDYGTEQSVRIVGLP